MIDMSDEALAKPSSKFSRTRSMVSSNNSFFDVAIFRAHCMKGYDSFESLFEGEQRAQGLRNPIEKHSRRFWHGSVDFALCLPLCRL